jgi:ABC-type nitrate/sulfonate/bicarbonate transport system substrate-binding protein
LRVRFAFLVVAVLALASLLAACGGGGSSSGDSTAAASSGGTDEGSAETTSSDSETDKIRYLSVTGLPDQLEIAKSLGYLPSVEIESVGTLTGGPEAIQDVGTGQIDIGVSFNGAILKAIAAGVPIKAVNGFSGSDDKYFEALYVGKGSSIKNAHDLVGKKIGVNTLGAQEEFWLHIWLKKEGLSPSEISQVSLVVIPPINAEQALTEGQLDGIALLGVFREKAEQSGNAELLVKDTEIFGGPYTSNSFFVSDDFLKNNPSVAKEVVSGLAKANHYLQTTPAPQVIKLLTKIAEENGRTEEIEGLELFKSAGVKNPYGTLTADEFEPWAQYLEEEGELEKGQIPLEEAFTNEFNTFAGKGGA